MAAREAPLEAADVQYYHAALTCTDTDRMFFGPSGARAVVARLGAAVTQVLETGTTFPRAPAIAPMAVDPADTMDGFVATARHPLTFAARRLLHHGYADLNMLRRTMQPLWPWCSDPEAVGPAPNSALAAVASPAARCFLRRLFVSGKHAAGQPSLLDAFRVRGVVCCYSGGAALEPSGGTSRQRLVLPAVDDDEYDVTQHFAEAAAFVKDVLGDPDAAVLVHCAAGMHRCAAVAAGVLVLLCGLSVDEAVAVVAVARPVAAPTPAFLAKMRAWALSVEG